jgi:hypothetical protein
MTERDAMTLLTEANPVRAGDLPPLDASVVDRILAGRPRSRRVVALAAAAALAALAAVLIATLTTRGGSSRPSTGPMEASLFTPTVEHPLPGKEVTLADASAELGQPIVLPDTSLVRPADAGHVWISGGPPNLTAAVNFPSAGVFVEYTAPPPSQDPTGTYQRIAQENPRSFETIDLNGATALTVKQNTDDTGHNFGGVVFVLNGLEIRVFGHYDAATLLTLAESIVDQERPPATQTLGFGSPPSVGHPLPGAQQVSLPMAAAAFGAPLVQPDTAGVGPSGAGPVWLVDRPQLTMVAVTYPAANVWVDYSWPASYDGGYDDRLLRYHTTGNSSTHTVLLDGVPAQGVFHSWKQLGWSGFYPSVRFAAGGVDVRVAGRRRKATLLTIARSIVDRSEQPPAGQLGDVAGVQVYPYLGDGRQISLPEASATLGSPVVLPDSTLAPAGRAQAWAEGTCPHPAARPATTEVCAVWVSYPGSGLSVGYIRPPAYLGSGKEWRLQARGLGGRSSAVELDGTPALSIHRNPAAGYPGRVAFDLAGTRVVVAGDYSPARLQEVAQSIVDRSRS